jgi:hypothetical protein
MSYIRFAVVAAVLAVFFSCQKSPVSGTTDETVLNSARIYNLDRSPAVNATVKVFAAGDTSRIPVYQTATDTAGRYSIAVSRGVYNIMAGLDTLGSFQDSVFVESLYSTLRSDTLSHLAAVRGVLVMQPMHDPRTATVQVLGTDKYSNVLQDGSFVIAGLPHGSYSLRAATTLAEYTPTFAPLQIGAQLSDMRDTITMIYTGIPAVASISATYDTVRGIVTISWDTVDYPLLRDFLVYRDVAPILSPSTVPFGSSLTCKYSDSIAGNFLGSQLDYVYRVAVRAKNLAVGQTFTDVQVSVIQPFTVYRIKDSAIVLGSPFMVQLGVGGKTNSSISYLWDIGNKGTFIPSQEPETTIVLHDTLAVDYQCAVKVLIDGKLFFEDTAHFLTQLGWQKLAPHFPDSSSWMKMMVLGGKIIAFTRPLSTPPGGARFAEWQSADAQTWTKIADSLVVPFSSLESPIVPQPAVFLNKICLVDQNGYLWTTPDAVTWSKASSAPLCGTVQSVGDSATWQHYMKGKLCVPALFVEGQRILCQPFPGTGSSAILSSSDLATWDSTTGYQMQSFVCGYAEMNGTLAVAGFDWSTAFGNAWFCTKNTSSRSCFGDPDSSMNSNYACDNIYSLVAFKNKFVYVSAGPNVKVLNDAQSGFWYPCAAVPQEAASDVRSLVLFNGTLYLISPNGIFRAVS